MRVRLGGIQRRAIHEGLSASPITPETVRLAAVMSRHLRSWSASGRNIAAGEVTRPIARPAGHRPA
jgi:hypothetical protein